MLPMKLIDVAKMLNNKTTHSHYLESVARTVATRGGEEDAMPRQRTRE